MMYACGHDSTGERNPEYERLLPHQRMGMSSGQCPKCVELRDKHVMRDGFCTCPADLLQDKDHWKVCPETLVKVSDNIQSPQIIGPDPEILAIMRLFLEKYEVLSEKDRSAYGEFIRCMMNPPVIFNNVEEK